MTDKQIKRRLRYLKNKDTQKVKVKEYYEANKESILSQSKKYRSSLKDNFYSLYYLTEDHYVGVTNQLKNRMYNHKNKGKHVLDYEVIATFETKREALNAERYMQDSLSYLGSGIKYNNQFAKKS
mgnify:CR=1 FL=1|tara:strand:+ start:357 stop:731 length:375 start_codon:yes stop_codon:yes gene_type:complete